MAALLRSKLMASAPCPSTPSSAWVMATVAMSVTTSMTRFLGSGHALRTPWHGFKKAHATRNFGNSWYLAGFAPSTAALDEVFMICLPSFHVLFSRVFSENLEDQKSLLGTTGCLPPFKRFMYRSFWNMLLVLFRTVPTPSFYRNYIYVIIYIDTPHVYPKLKYILKGWWRGWWWYLDAQSF